MTDMARAVIPPKRPKPKHPLPACYGLLGDQTRSDLWLYRTLGYVGVVITEAMAYIELLEEELARHEAGGTVR